jgi:hypothetical protein
LASSDSDTEHERPGVEWRFSQEATFEADFFKAQFIRPTATEIRPVSLEVHSDAEVRDDGG